MRRLTVPGGSATLGGMVEMVRSSGIRGFQDLVRRLGGDPRPLLRRHRISAQSLADEESLIPLQPVAEMLEDAATVLACPEFGLRLGGLFDPSILGPVGVALQHSSTVEEALQLAIRYLFVQTPALGLCLIPQTRPPRALTELRLEFFTPGWRFLPQAVELCLAGWDAIVRSLAGDSYHLEAVSIPHQPAAPLSVYRQHFGAKIRTAQPHAALVLSTATIKAPLREVSRTLHLIAEDYLRTHYPLSRKPVASRVRTAIDHAMGAAAVDKTAIAGALAMHPRTLQRHLASEDTCFETILDEVRRDNAARYLTSTQIPLKHVAGLLGLAHQSALTRSCQRWFGATPTVLRRASTAA